MQTYFGFQHTFLPLLASPVAQKWLQRTQNLEGASLQLDSNKNVLLRANYLFVISNPGPNFGCLIPRRSFLSGNSLGCSKTRYPVVGELDVKQTGLVQRPYQHIVGFKISVNDVTIVKIPNGAGDLAQKKKIGNTSSQGKLVASFTQALAFRQQRKKKQIFAFHSNLLSNTCTTVSSKLTSSFPSTY